MSAIAKWLLAALIAVLLGSVHLLDGPNDIDTAQAASEDLADAIQTARAAAKQARRETVLANH